MGKRVESIILFVILDLVYHLELTPKFYKSMTIDFFVIRIVSIILKFGNISGSMTSVMRRMHWTRWTVACWTGGSSGFRWPGTEGLPLPTGGDPGQREGGTQPNLVFHFYFLIYSLIFIHCYCDI
jgi:hypothetical protein